MISGSQKRRNVSREIGRQSRLYFNRHSNSSLLLTASSQAPILKDKSPNRALNPSSTDDNLLKKRSSLTPFKPTHQLFALDKRFSAFSSKIKTLLRGEEQGNKENQYTSNNTTKFDRRNLLNRREAEDPSLVEAECPYFIECVTRKTLISTEACMHIHSSMVLLKEYSKWVGLAKARAVDSRIPSQREGRKTVVLDMDETLIHTNEVMLKGYEIKVPFKSLQGRVIHGYVNVRPHAQQLIKNLNKYFDVIVFTAGNQCYADPILDYLDPQGCIQHRLYRQSCTLLNNQLFVKDLRILGRKLQNVVLVDNAPYSYLLQLPNGIPILSYFKGKDDDQLQKLERYLMTLQNVPDVRTINTGTFRLHDYHRYDNYDRLIRELYGKWL